MKGISNKFSEALFNQVHQRNLVYNTCWEDPRCDRQLLDLQKDSEVVMITSAGCNALDYLMDSPAKIECVDMNPRQNALLELKTASMNSGTYHEHFALFGNGKSHFAKDYYVDDLREKIPSFAQQYWDTNITYFSGKGIRKSFYYYGSSGVIAWIFNKYLKSNPRLFSKIEQLINAKNIDEQRFFYQEIEPMILNNTVKWILNRHLTMCMLGVPKSQQDLFTQKYKNGAAEFIQNCLKKVFMETPIQDNYFWRVYIDGVYSSECCPNYLKKENYELIAKHSHKIQTHTNTLSSFLQQNPGEYSHYVLLDHQDWLANYHLAALEEEWKLILRNSRQGTKILLRSAGEKIDFFPDFVKKSVCFESSQTVNMHKEDRVGTYGSVYLGTVK
jgi:S-adenosylmethionine-diacylglycerol 3-amino-3-carboxypropyl transferase